ncbi:trypsin-like serine protease [Corallococcus interemptor]|uniref:trypsin-like serine protease n=1 Tax=Corallococcus interemptor TaxID=2316720 RepID=UPI0035D3F33D
MLSALTVRRWAIASTIALLIGCGAEDITEQHSQSPGQSIQQDIVGGTNTTISDNPWQVSLQTSSGFHFCGGSVINANWILTAQHCVNYGGVISTPARVVAGITNISGSNSGQIRTVAEVVPYPGYVGANKGKDVALLRLSSPLELSSGNVQAIGLVTAADASGGVTGTGVVSRVTGWGTLASGGSSPDTLQTVDVSILSNISAQSSYPNETITADQLASAAPGKDSCQGDSGGPLTVLKGSTRVLAGVVSWGYGCADSRYPGMYARVSSFAPWIDRVIAGARRVALYRHYNRGSGDHFYTLSSSVAGYVSEGVSGFVLATQIPGSTPLYRYFNSRSGDHFYTTNWSDLGFGRDGYAYEWVEAYVPTDSAPDTANWYRYFNTGNGDHFYTTNWNELGAGGGGWIYEGVRAQVYTTP